MKNIKIMAILALSVLLFAQTSAASIDNIEAINDSTIELTTSSDVTFSPISVEGEVKLLKDVNISMAGLDPNNTKKVLLNLSDSLMPSTSYSLISIIGPEGNMDFTLGSEVMGEIANATLGEMDEGITRINVVDPMTLELYYKSDVVSEVFEYKILSDIPLASMTSLGDNMLTLDIESTLTPAMTYIVMILALEDANGNTVDFNEDLHEFVTPASFVEEQMTEEEMLEEQMQEEEAVMDNQEEGNIEEVAMDTTETPATGTATWIILMIAIALSVGIVMRKKAA